MPNNSNVLSFVHMALVFVLHMSPYDAAFELLEMDYPWVTLAVFLNTLVTSCKMSRIESNEFLFPEKGDVRPLRILPPVVCRGQSTTFLGTGSPNQQSTMKNVFGGCINDRCA